MPKKTTQRDRELRREFCNKVWPLIGKGKKFRSQLEAANHIGISPQRLNSYLKSRATPSHNVLGLISERWGLEFVVFGTTLKPSQLRPLKATIARSAAPIQLNLYDEPQTITSKDGKVIVRVERKGEVTLGLSFELVLVK